MKLSNPSTMTSASPTIRSMFLEVKSSTWGTMLIVLFIVDKFAGAGYLVDEMDVVKTPAKVTKEQQQVLEKQTNVKAVPAR